MASTDNDNFQKPNDFHMILMEMETMLNQVCVENVMIHPTLFFHPMFATKLEDMIIKDPTSVILKKNLHMLAQRTILGDVKEFITTCVDEDILQFGKETEFIENQRYDLLRCLALYMTVITKPSTAFQPFLDVLEGAKNKYLIRLFDYWLEKKSETELDSKENHAIWICLPCNYVNSSNDSVCWNCTETNPNKMSFAM